jgi:hypothetical protein
LGVLFFLTGGLPFSFGVTQHCSGTRQPINARESSQPHSARIHQYYATLYNLSLDAQLWLVQTGKDRWFTPDPAPQSWLEMASCQTHYKALPSGPFPINF